ncbi:MAG: hypothetical protein SP1CHLAM54_10990 [Chlamydiia bacterium]|nr:hypothetical protein [Chlamydiia bacterium]MCH9616004.1 hypothetical protein [Chlamydiia bacterium]MCH9629027.1 hypothetical protein [Chlamydiia bacterium]
MTQKKPSETQITDHTYRVFPNDLNSLGTVFGGLIMSTIDRLALVVAERHSGNTCVTASVDSVHFLAPAGRGDNLIFQVTCNRAWNSSMELGCRVVAERDGQETHIVSAYLTFVALDKHNHPAKVPVLEPVSDAEKRRFEEAGLRRANRIAQKEEIKQSRERDGTN